MKELFLINGTKLQCDKGTALSELVVTSQKLNRIDNQLQATEEDKKANENILPFGVCAITQKSCIPNPLKWENAVKWSTINGMASITTKSTLPCALGGLIKHKDVGQKGHGIGQDTQEDRKSITEQHFEIERVEFLDENNQVLTPKMDADFDAKVSPIFYGEQAKIRITTKNAKNGDKISFSLKGHSKSESQEFEGIGFHRWDLSLTNNQYTTDLFYLKQSWYSEDLENYEYKNHTTKASSYNEFYVEGELNGKNFVLPEKEQRLIPKAYKRNYEELIGLFKTDNSGEKDLKNNYENHFIKDTKAGHTADFFIFTLDNESVSDTFSENSIYFTAKQLWNRAIEEVQGGNLDDRPLYWARNKMQVAIKRLPIFKDQINYKTSQVKPNTDLAKIIQLFEEKSRNYTGINFNSPEAAGCKKVLITGFDPFLLNSIKYPKQYNILQSNPSGVMALVLANNNNLGAYIQTMIVPVRYTDFDGSQEYDKGQGEGVIEKYIRPFIGQVDMIITISQAFPEDYHIDVFATATRGGGDDNMNFIRVSGSKSLSDSAPETIKTTLPIEFTQNGSKAIYWGEYYQRDGTSGNATIDKIPTEKVYDGPGGNYLSNEIFYRVAKLREENFDKTGNKGKLKTGHFHISKIQDEEIMEDLKQDKILKVLENIKQALIEGFKVI